jgi:hypothetical protein
MHDYTRGPKERRSERERASCSRSQRRHPPRRSTADEFFRLRATWPRRCARAEARSRSPARAGAGSSASIRNDFVRRGGRACARRRDGGRCVLLAPEGLPPRVAPRPHGRTGGRDLLRIASRSGHARRARAQIAGPRATGEAARVPSTGIIPRPYPPPVATFRTPQEDRRALSHPAQSGHPGALTTARPHRVATGHATGRPATCADFVQVRASQSSRLLNIENGLELMKISLQHRRRQLKLGGVRLLDEHKLQFRLQGRSTPYHFHEHGVRLRDGRALDRRSWARMAGYLTGRDDGSRPSIFRRGANRGRRDRAAESSWSSRSRKRTREHSRAAAVQKYTSKPASARETGPRDQGAAL